jgi:hypothetical protein
LLLKLIESYDQGNVSTLDNTTFYLICTGEAKQSRVYLMLFCQQGRAGQGRAGCEKITLWTALVNNHNETVIE